MLILHSMRYMNILHIDACVFVVVPYTHMCCLVCVVCVIYIRFSCWSLNPFCFLFCKFIPYLFCFCLCSPYLCGLCLVFFVFLVCLFFTNNLVLRPALLKETFSHAPNHSATRTLTRTNMCFLCLFHFPMSSFCVFFPYQPLIYLLVLCVLSSLSTNKIITVDHSM